MKLNFEEYLDIDVKNGKCYWKNTISKYHRNLIGKEAGTPQTSRGKTYWVVRINGKGYKRSHIVYWKRYGKLPSCVIDHKDGNSLNDKIENLRDVSYQMNSQNRKSGYRGKVLPIGVRKGYTNKNGETRYSSRIKHNGITIYLGGYKTPEEAAQAYQTKQKEYV